MKNILYICFALLLFITSCSSDDGPDISPIVGAWTLDKITISNPPSGHQFAVSTTPTATVFGEVSYEIEFFDDMTYERTLRETIFGRVDDSGTWELIDTELDLDQEETNAQDLPVSFDVDGDISERGMTLITEDFWFAWPPEIVNDPVAFDTLDGSQEQINQLFNERGVLVLSTFELEFELEN